MLPDRLKEQAHRKAFGEFKAVLQRLAGDQVGGRVYAQLMKEQEKLFTSISEVLPVWCVTNLSVRGSLPFEAGLFDIVVIDEASQCDIASLVPLLYRARRAVIIGDPQQLRHISALRQDQNARLLEKHGLAEDQELSDQQKKGFTQKYRDLRESSEECQALQKGSQAQSEMLRKYQAPIYRRGYVWVFLRKVEDPEAVEAGLQRSE